MDQELLIIELLSAAEPIRIAKKIWCLPFYF